MKNLSEKISGSLIISRLQQVEITSMKGFAGLDSQFLPLITTATLKPFFANLPLNLGLTLRLIGSKIISAEIDRGYFFHGLEENLAEISSTDALALISRLNPELPIFYQIALAKAFEKLTDWPVDKDREKNLLVAMEFARVSHHLKVIKNVLYCLDLDTIADMVVNCEQILHLPFMLSTRMRSKTEKIHLISPADLYLILSEALIQVEELSATIDATPEINDLLHKKAVITLRQAGLMGLTGLYLKANQNAYDLRNVDFNSSPRIYVTEGGDAKARFLLRILEVTASLKWLKQMFLTEKKPFSPLIIEENYCQTSPRHRFAFSEIESPEGCIKICIFTNSENSSLLFRLRTPAYFIAQAIPHMLLNTDLKDLAFLLYSLGIEAEEVDK